jgi:hypothetical protein
MHAKILGTSTWSGGLIRWRYISEENWRGTCRSAFKDRGEGVFGVITGADDALVQAEE